MRTSWLRSRCALTLAILAGCSSSALSHDGSLDGRVLLAGVGDQPAILVTLSGPSSASTMSDATGAFHFAQLPVGDYVVIASAGSTREGTLVAAAHVAGPTTLADLTFQPVGTLAGHADLGAATGNAGITVFASGSSAVAITDDAGNYTLADVAPGAYDVQAMKSGYITATVTGQTARYSTTTSVPDLVLTAATTTTSPLPTVTLRGTATLVGTTSRSGTQVSIAGTTLTATTAADGTFAIADVPQGVYTLQLQNGAWEEAIPSVLALPGNDGQVIDGTLYPLTPIELQRAHRIASGATSLALSADGSHTLFRTRYDSSTGDSDLWVAPVKGGGPAVELASDAYQYNAQLSRDSSTLVYQRAPLTNGYRALVVASTASGASTLVANGVDQFALSPDGQAVVFHVVDGSTNGLVQTAATAGGVATTVAGAVRFCGYSPDSQRLSVLSSSALQLIKLADGSRTTISGTGCNQWTPDSQQILIEDANGLERAPLSGTPTSPIYGGYSFSNCFFSPDGRQLFVWSYPTSGGDMLIEADIDTGAVTPLAGNSSTSHMPRFSPDSRALAFMLSDGTVQAWSATGGIVTLGKATVNDDGLRISPDSSKVMYSALAQLYVVPIGGGSPTALGAVQDTSGFGSTEGEFDFSGDGQTAVFLRGSDLLAEPIGGGTTTLLGSPVSPRQHGLSPDGTHVWMLVGVGASSSGTLQVASTSGAAAPLIVLDSPQNLQQSITWVDDHTLIGARVLSPAPYPFQDGIYAAPIP